MPALFRRETDGESHRKEEGFKGVFIKRNAHDKNKLGPNLPSRSRASAEDNPEMTAVRGFSSGAVLSMSVAFFTCPVSEQEECSIKPSGCEFIQSALSRPEY